MENKKQIHYMKMLDVLKEYRFKLYKGRLWRYDTQAGILFSVEIDVTRWGTLNEVFFRNASYQSPIQPNIYVKSRTPLCTTALRSCGYIGKHHDIWTFGYGGDSIDDIFAKQMKDVLPYIFGEIIPLMQCENNIVSYLHFAETLQDKAYELPFSIDGGVDTDLALEYYHIHDRHNALRIMDKRVIFCERVIAMYHKRQENPKSVDLSDPIKQWEQFKLESIELTHKMECQSSEVDKLIQDNIAQSKQCCEAFFLRYK